MSTNDPFAKPPVDGPAIDLNPDEFAVDVPEEQDNFSAPDGEYDAKVVGLKKDFSQNGNPMWVWDFAIVGGAHANKEFRTYTALTNAAMWKLREVLAALGLVSGANAQASKFSKSDALNRMCRITLVTEEYKGRKRSTIATVSPFPELGKKAPMTSSGGSSPDVPF